MSPCEDNLQPSSWHIKTLWNLFQSLTLWQQWQCFFSKAKRKQITISCNRRIQDEHWTMTTDCTEHTGRQACRHAQLTPGAEPVEVLTTHQGRYPLATYSQVKGMQLLRAELLWFPSATMPWGLWGETLIFKFPNLNKNLIAAHLHILQKLSTWTIIQHLKNFFWFGFSFFH